jgi:radical SAM domain protein
MSNKNFYNYNILENSICNQCKYKNFCNGGCMGMSYNILGKLGLGDIRCPIVKKYYEEKCILF